MAKHWLAATEGRTPLLVSVENQVKASISSLQRAEADATSTGSLAETPSSLWLTSEARGHLSDAEEMARAEDEKDWHGRLKDSEIARVFLYVLAGNSHELRQALVAFSVIHPEGNVSSNIYQTRFEPHDHLSTARNEVIENLSRLLRFDEWEDKGPIGPDT